MSDFNIVKNVDIENTFRVAKIKNDFDVKETHLSEKFTGKIDMPKNWNIGLIVGGSGTGKSTIGYELFGDKIIDNFKYISKSVVDDMPKDASIDDITKMFYSVGFGSVPSWLKPYNVLSNGEKMRVDLARKMLDSDFVVFDEFTSVVDREVAKTMCIAINKMISKNKNKKFVAISCHYDIIEYLQPDWVFDTNEMKQTFQLAHAQKKNTKSENAGNKSGLNLGDIII